MESPTENVEGDLVIVVADDDMGNAIASLPLDVVEEVLQLLHRCQARVRIDKAFEQADKRCPLPPFSIEVWDGDRCEPGGRGLHEMHWGSDSGQ